MALIPRRFARPLAAIGISLGLHAALLAFVRVAPLGARGGGDSNVIEARLVPRVSVAQVMPPDAAPAPERDATAAPVSSAPVETPDALPATPAPDAAAHAPPSPAAQAGTGPLPAAPQQTPALAIPSGADLNYYRARELDVQPRALHDILPEYPPDADRQRLSGKVRLQIKLEADGRVGDVEVVGAEPPGTFEESALKSFRAARFAPAQKDGRPVRALLMIEVKYDWEGSVERGTASGRVPRP